MPNFAAEVNTIPAPFFRTALDAGRSDAAVLQMAAYGWTDAQVTDLLRFEKTASPVNNASYFPFRDDKDIVKYARHGHFCIRHTFKYCTLNAVLMDAHNSFWPPGTTFHHIDEMVRDTMRAKNTWVPQGADQYQLNGVLCRADNANYNVMLRYTEPHMSQFYPIRGQGGITDYTQAEMNEFIDVDAR